MIKGNTERYIEGNGGRKTATARVRIIPGGQGVTVNDAPLARYFKMPKYQATVLEPLAAVDLAGKEAPGFSAHVRGGGLHAQAEAVRHALSRALVLWNEEFRKKLRRAGFLTRDARIVERKKYGLKKARRSPQWSKR